ncbi:ABC transporter permease [Variovorax arabinosiphilus]|uniref:ABC transporter permease n=1 Tax=Variovorax arabinosiphilus TaxID=3053498 RepID=UPI002574DE0C|nr:MULTISPECIES: ABC transporter permease [unclassified Variovorax]MDM0121282.1 ABC transporter permease [Variovorax sp. J2L1-78]MDM0130343.1 ABC transporter permease [Variovorax sp. J2L1-63]MDM0234045.1 ABC transporter permease [Variovorax sp. J2R1-6]
MRNALKEIALPAFAIAAALLVFGVLVWFAGVSPVDVWVTLFKGAFGDWFSWQNTLQRAAPLMLTALCVAIPARAGLVIIGGEGAVVLGGLACAALPYAIPLPGNIVGTVAICFAGAVVGALWIMLAGWLRQYRGINETISSLLLAYIAIGIFKHLVEGALRDPASLNKPSTRSLPDGLGIGGIAGSDVHWGLVIGIVACVGLGLWLRATASGFSIRVVGGNPRTAQLVGLPATQLILAACGVGGACAGVAGAVEVAAVHTNANASIIAGYGYAGILVSFIARHNPIAIIPVAILFGGFGAAGSLLQRRLGLPDASVLVLQGIAFVLILASEGLRMIDWKTLLKNRMPRAVQPKLVKEST